MPQRAERKGQRRFAARQQGRNAERRRVRQTGRGAGRRKQKSAHRVDSLQKGGPANAASQRGQTQRRTNRRLCLLGEDGRAVSKNRRIRNPKSEIRNRGVVVLSVHQKSDGAIGKKSRLGQVSGYGAPILT